MARKMRGGMLWLWIVVLVIVVAVIYIFVINRTVSTAEFVCADGKTITAEFKKGFVDHVNLKLSDGRNLTLNVTASAGGARYANSGETIVFWNIGNTARLEENNTETFKDCVTQ